MRPLSAVVCHAAADDVFYRAFVAGLERANVEVIRDEYGVPELYLRPLDEAELRAAQVFIVLLSRAALASPRVRSETRRYVELQADDLSRMVLPVVIEPIDPATVWPFLQPYRRVEGMVGTHLSAEALVRGTLRALGIYVDPYEMLVPEPIEEEQQPYGWAPLARLTPRLQPGDLPPSAAPLFDEYGVLPAAGEATPDAVTGQDIEEESRGLARRWLALAGAVLLAVLLLIVMGFSLLHQSSPSRPSTTPTPTAAT